MSSLVEGRIGLLDLFHQAINQPAFGLRHAWHRSRCTCSWHLLALVCRL